MTDDPEPEMGTDRGIPQPDPPFTIWDIIIALADLDSYAATVRNGELHIAPIDDLKAKGATIR